MEMLRNHGKYKEMQGIPQKCNNGRKCVQIHGYTRKIREMLGYSKRCYEKSLRDIKKRWEMQANIREYMEMLGNVWKYIQMQRNA